MPETYKIYNITTNWFITFIISNASTLNNLNKMPFGTEVVPFTEVSHTIDNLKAFLSKVLSDWDISSKVVAVVRDNGTEITAALNRSEFEAIPCVDHTLQFVVKDGLINNPKIINLLKKMQETCWKF
jgi:hypothetical protein